MYICHMCFKLIYIFFQPHAPQTFSEVTGVSEELIERLAVILAVLHCGRDVDWPRFQRYAMATYRLIVSLYPWFYVPSSVHSVLMHAAPVMSVLALPPSYYDEGNP